MISLARLVKIDKTLSAAVYRQVADGIIALIRRGLLHPGTRIQGTRELSVAFQVHRKTIVAAYQELVDEGWIDVKPRKGFYISQHRPDADPKKLFEHQDQQTYPTTTGFSLRFKEIPVLNQLRMGGVSSTLTINDGFPDLRLLPVQEMMREYHSIAQRKSTRKYFGYSPMQGSANLREELARHLRQTRGMHVTPDNILITKGAQMAIHVASSLLIQPGDNIIAGEPGYFIANLAFKNLGANILHVPVDAHGIRVDAVEKLCRRKKIRMIYVVPHHHHPTTVTLSPERRLQLLDLAAQYKIAVIEDDYDFDLHYNGSPVLPMASFDRFGNIIYIGTLSKILAPAIRIGFMVAPENLIRAACHKKFLLDLQGDNLMEETMASLYKNGFIDRHIKKSRKIYGERRDFFCARLEETLGSDITFKTPEGGMSVWVHFNKHDTAKIAIAASKIGLTVNDGKRYNTGPTDHNSMRLGFASLNVKELEEAVTLLKRAVTLSEKK
jgi:GntR family transcriptional regulator/MocR family aminotransferase